MTIQVTVRTPTDKAARIQTFPKVNGQPVQGGEWQELSSVAPDESRDFTVSDTADLLITEIEPAQATTGG